MTTTPEVKQWEKMFDERLYQLAFAIKSLETSKQMLEEGSKLIDVAHVKSQGDRVNEKYDDIKSFIHTVEQAAYKRAIQDAIETVPSVERADEEPENNGFHVCRAIVLEALASLTSK